MIVYYTKYNVIESFDTSSLLELAFDCVKGMKNAPDCFKKISTDNEESGEWRDNNNLLAFGYRQEFCANLILDKSA